MAEMEFLDGKREVADHIRGLLIGIETYKLTWQQARDLVNRRLQEKVIGDYQAKFIAQHFRDQRER